MPPNENTWTCTLSDFPVEAVIEHGDLPPEARIEDIPVREETLLLSVRVTGRLPRDACAKSLASFWNYAGLVQSLDARGGLRIRDSLEHEAAEILDRVRADCRELPQADIRIQVRLRRPGLRPPADVVIELEGAP
jgi:dihydroneopterin aldolase